MSNEDLSGPAEPVTSERAGPAPHPKPKRRLGRGLLFGAAAAALLVVGGGIGAKAVSHMRPAVQMALATPVAIASMPKDGIVTVKGSVAEIYGNKFVLSDASGRTLIETGRAGEDGKLVKPNEELTVQGRFDDGFVKAAFLVRADGKVEAIGGFGKKGPKHERGPKHGPDRDGPRGGGPDGPRGTDGRL